jgi:hypothetical protein
VGAGEPTGTQPVRLCPEYPLKWTDPSGHCPVCAAIGWVFTAAGFTVSAPVVVGVAAVLGVAALAAFLSDETNRAWLAEQLQGGIDNVDTFVEELTGRTEHLAQTSGNPSWNKLKPFRGKTKTNGEKGRDKRYYEKDHTHGDVEVYDSNGNHLGSMDPNTGEMTKPPVPGRRIDI